eukprot:2637406-Alexandrium_andersonii.AAC.1
MHKPPLNLSRPARTADEKQTTSPVQGVRTAQPGRGSKPPETDPTARCTLHTQQHSTHNSVDEGRRVNTPRPRVAEHPRRPTSSRRTEAARATHLRVPGADADCARARRGPGDP